MFPNPRSLFHMFIPAHPLSALSPFFQLLSILTNNTTQPS